MILIIGRHLWAIAKTLTFYCLSGNDVKLAIMFTALRIHPWSFLTDSTWSQIDIFREKKNKTTEEVKNWRYYAAATLLEFRPVAFGFLRCLLDRIYKNKIDWHVLVADGDCREAQQCAVCQIGWGDDVILKIRLHNAHQRLDRDDNLKLNKTKSFPLTCVKLCQALEMVLPKRPCLFLKFFILIVFVIKYSKLSTEQYLLRLNWQILIDVTK